MDSKVSTLDMEGPPGTGLDHFQAGVLVAAGTPAVAVVRLPDSAGGWLATPRSTLTSPPSVKFSFAYRT
jgi:hypothetical protein